MITKEDKGHRLAIAGSRSWNDAVTIANKVKTHMHYPNILIVSGGAKGAHEEAEIVAEMLGLDKEVYYAKWNNPIGSDFAVLMQSWDFAAIGSGYQYALGALAALTDMVPQDRIIRSLGITSNLSLFTGGNIIVKCLKNEEE